MAKRKMTQPQAVTALGQIMEDTRRKIQEGLKKKKYTIEELAAKTDISVWKIRTCLYGNGMFSAEEVVKLGKFLDPRRAAETEMTGEMAEDMPEAEKQPGIAEDAESEEENVAGGDKEEKESTPGKEPAPGLNEEEDAPEGELPAPDAPALDEGEALSVIRPILHILPAEKKAAAVRAVMRVYLGTEKEDGYVQ